MQSVLFNAIAGKRGSQSLMATSDMGYVLEHVAYL